jgi:outer membrane protein assembly factor BamC
MRRISVQLVVVGMSLLVLGGCSSLRDRSNDYRKATLSEPLQLPPGMRSDSLDDRYVVPGIQEHAALSGEFVPPRPEGIAKNVGHAEVRIQKLDNARWILADGNPNQNWPRVRAFLDRVGLKLAAIDGNRGAMESEWRTPEPGSPPERFRFSLEQGVQVGTSEISVVVQTRPGEVWPQKSDDPQREETMVRILAQYLADSQAESAVSVLARHSGSKQEGKIFIEGEGNNQYLHLRLPEERAWAALGLALEKSGFEIEEFHRSVNKYWLSYINPDEDEPGWFASLFGINNVKKSRYVVEMRPIGKDEALIYLNYQKGRRLKAEERDILLRRIMGYMH